MSTPKVRLSNIDRGIGIFTAVNVYKSRKINEQMLAQQISNNKHLSDLKRQMSEANSVNRQVLENQIRSEKQKEEQKFYKALSFNLNEMVEIISKTEDEMMLNYLLMNYYEKIKSNIIEANDRLDEINDKTYNKVTLDKLNEIKGRALKSRDKFENSVFRDIDRLAAEFKEEENRIEGLRMPVFIEEKVNIRWKNNPLRIFGIIVLGLISLFFALGMIAGIGTDTFVFSMVFLLFFGTPLFFLIKAERKWRTEFESHKRLQIEKRREFEKNKSLIHKEFTDTVEREKEALMNHKFYSAMVEIYSNYPNFEEVLSGITQLEMAFEKKWGV